MCVICSMQHQKNRQQRAQSRSALWEGCFVSPVPLKSFLATYPDLFNKSYIFSSCEVISLILADLVPTICYISSTTRQNENNKEPP